eukprot:s740_g22.t1
MEEVVEGTTTVKVAVRVRPLSDKEIREGGTECVEVTENSVTLVQENQQPHVFAFDHVFGVDSTQPQVFDMLGMPLLDKAFEGYNATIFAYGQTGSGKTHTMMADRKSDDRGLIPRISDNLFQRVGSLSSETHKFLICCSFLEIYNEIVYDLLVPRGKNAPKTGLEIREGKGIGVYVKDLQEIVVDSSDKVLKLIDQGFEHRATAATQMNATSSRSHCLFIIKMHQKDEQNAGNNNFSKMNLVDLAGSERASRTGAQGDLLKEGANINKSLSALGNVINALSSMASGSKKARDHGEKNAKLRQQVFIPYRNSKLTRVLQESLGGNALTTMMAALSPSKTNADESLSTLNYAKRAKTIKVNATKNDEAEQIAKLEEEVEALRAKLAEQATGVADTSRYENQIAEMEMFMKQTWEDKEKQSLQHEEERKRLEQEAQRNMERLNEERKRRFLMLEEKGDLELLVQELKALKGGEKWTLYTSTWPSQVARLLALESRVTAQCRAAVLLRDAVLHDVDHWCEKQRQVQEAGGKEEDGGAGLRILLQQAERKVGTMLREFDSLAKQEQELAGEIAGWIPQVQKAVRGIALEGSEEEEKERDKTEEGGKEAKEASNEVSEEFVEVLSLILRQLDSHRMKIWGQVAEDHKALGGFTAQLKTLAECSSALGAQFGQEGCVPAPEALADMRQRLGDLIHDGGPALLSLPVLRATYAKFTTALCRLCCHRLELEKPSGEEKSLGACLRHFCAQRQSELQRIELLCCQVMRLDFFEPEAFLQRGVCQTRPRQKAMEDLKVYLVWSARKGFSAAKHALAYWRLAECFVEELEFRTATQGALLEDRTFHSLVEHAEISLNLAIRYDGGRTLHGGKRAMVRGLETNLGSSAASQHLLQRLETLRSARRTAVEFLDAPLIAGGPQEKSGVDAASRAADAYAVPWPMEARCLKDGEEGQVMKAV